MVWQILFPVLLAAIVYKIITRFIDGQLPQDINIPLPGYLREVGVIEYILQCLFKANTFVISSCIIVHSKTRMDNSKVKEALQIIAKRHPLLQAAITEVYRPDGKHYYFTKMSSVRVHYRQSEKIAIEPSDWHDVMTKDVLEPINDRDGPLWRCCRLKECIDSETNKITNCFVFTFHHAIIDGISMTTLLEEFMRILHKLHKNEPVPDIHFCLRPSLETLLGEKLYPKWWTRIIVKVLQYMLKIGLYSLKSKKIDAYFNKYPVIRNVYPDVQPENRAIFTSFSKSETKKLLQSCKQHGCTVNGAITAAASMVMADILQDGQVTKAQLIPSKYLISCRRHIDVKENGNTDYFGCYVKPFVLNCYVPAYDSQSFFHVFWKTANDITEDVHKNIRTLSYLQDLKGLQCFSLSHLESAIHSSVWGHHGGRDGDSLFLISNVGRFDEHSNCDSLFRIEKLFGISAGHEKEHLFQIFIVSVNERLCCSFVYFPHVTAKEQAEEFNSKILQNLRCAFNKV